MKKPCIKTSTLVLAAACLFFFTSSVLVHAAQYYSMGTGSAAATYYYVGAGFAHLVKKYMPDVRITAESTAASAENAHLITRSKIDFGFSTAMIKLFIAGVEITKVFGSCWSGGVYTVKGAP